MKTSLKTRVSRLEEAVDSAVSFPCVLVIGKNEDVQAVVQSHYEKYPETRGCAPPEGGPVLLLLEMHRQL